MWSGALATAGDVVFYGTLEGYLKAVDAKTGKELYKFKTPSGIIGNVMTYTHKGKQYVAMLSGVGGWAGIGLAAGLTGPERRPRRGRRLRRPEQLHRARRPADRLRPAELTRRPADRDIRRPARLTPRRPRLSETGDRATPNPAPRRMAAAAVPIDTGGSRVDPSMRSSRDAALRARLDPQLAARRRRAAAAEAEDAKPAREENGKYFDADDDPTYSIKADGTVDWYTFPATAAITRNAMPATAPTAWARAMRRPSSTA